MNENTEALSTDAILRESEERLRFALEGSNQGVWDWNIQTGAIYFSPSWKKMLGFAEADVIDSIAAWETRIHPDDREQLSRDLKTHFNSEQPVYENCYRLRAKDGNYRWIQGRGKIISRAADGTPLRMIGTHTDITEKRESEEQYRNLFHITPLPTWIYDFDTLRFLEVNEAAIQAYGFTRAEFLAMSLFDIRPAEQHNALAHALANCERQQKATYSNWCHKKKNGDLIVVELNSTTISYNGRKARLVVVNDITQKVAAEEELRQSHLRFLYVTKATSDAVYDLNTATGHLAWGKGITTLFGHAEQEMPLKKWEEYIHPDERQTVAHSFSHTVYQTRKKFWKMEYRFATASGSYRYVIDKGFILRDEQHQPMRVIGAMQDITDLKQKQLELAEVNQRYEFATLATSDMIWDLDLETDQILWSENYEKVTGWKLPADKRLSRDFCLARFHPNDQERTLQSITEALHNKAQNVWEMELRYMKSDGSFAFINNRAYILRNEAGEAIRMIGAMQDISQRKKLEEELLQKELEKQKTISTATIETQERERSEIGKELHDNVNQVLTTTKLYLELAQSHAEMRDDLLQKSQRNIMYVINEIRQLSRSLMNPSLGDLGLVDAVHDLIESVQATGKLQVHFKNDGCALCLPHHLELTIYRIIQEALNNAVKHAQAQHVTITLHKKEQALALQIKDDGVGFDPKETKQGAGLRNIENRVYLANGCLSLQSHPGAGCTLTISFDLENHLKIR